MQLWIILINGSWHYCMSDSMELWLKHWFLGFTPRILDEVDSGSKNRYISEVPRWCPCCWSGDHNSEAMSWLLNFWMLLFSFHEVIIFWYWLCLTFLVTFSSFFYPSVVLNQGDFFLSPEDIWQCLEMFFIITYNAMEGQECTYCY